MNAVRPGTGLVLSVTLVAACTSMPYTTRIDIESFERLDGKVVISNLRIKAYPILIAFEPTP